jgi:maltooligosyltrehalose trehalohydrolase
VSADHFVVCIQNHDQVGNRAQGDRLSTLVPFEKRKLAAALYLLSPYVPLLFMGEEYDEINPFIYFVSHGDPELIESVRAGRRKEFEAFGWGDDIPDPAAEESFRRSRLDRRRSSTPEGGAMRALYRDLLRLRREERLLRPGTATVEVEHDELGRWIRLTLRGGAPAAERLVAVFNLADVRRDLDLSAGPGRTGLATRLIGTNDPAYTLDEPRRPSERTSADASARVSLPQSTAALFRLEST